MPESELELLLLSDGDDEPNAKDRSFPAPEAIVQAGARRPEIHLGLSDLGGDSGRR